ncbi:hypothetical protein RRG08_005704 [Elysia crispata]|uniref:Uncharacterized protein n=1 Tax=Elysia crispata TaxID=231223 RepID=A0AAE0YDN5_9GAST|nr:hypothetical protein RRG08_005704 [Elysia crispata]
MSATFNLKFTSNRPPGGSADFVRMLTREPREQIYGCTSGRFNCKVDVSSDLLCYPLKTIHYLLHRSPMVVVLVAAQITNDRGTFDLLCARIGHEGSYRQFCPIYELRRKSIGSEAPSAVTAPHEVNLTSVKLYGRSKYRRCPSHCGSP